MSHSSRAPHARLTHAQDHGRCWLLMLCLAERQLRWMKPDQLLTCSWSAIFLRHLPTTSFAARLPSSPCWRSKNSVRRAASSAPKSRRKGTHFSRVKLSLCQSTSNVLEGCVLTLRIPDSRDNRTNENITGLKNETELVMCYI